MSEQNQTVLACVDCDSSEVQAHGTNVRGQPGGRYYRCRACGARMVSPNRRAFKREPPDKPPHGLARRLWERGEAD